MNRFSKLIFSISTFAIFALVGINTVSAITLTPSGNSKTLQNLSVVCDNESNYFYGTNSLGNMGWYSCGDSIPIGDYYGDGDPLPMSVYVTEVTQVPCPDENDPSSCEFAVDSSEQFVYTGNTITQSATDIGSTATTIPTEAGKSVKNGLPYVLGVAGALIVLAIIITATYLWIANHGVGGSLSTSKVLGQGKSIGLSAPKGYHYTTFKKSNGESTSYLFKD